MMNDEREEEMVARAIARKLQNKLRRLGHFEYFSDLIQLGVRFEPVRENIRSRDAENRDFILVDGYLRYEEDKSPIPVTVLFTRNHAMIYEWIGGKMAGMYGRKILDTVWMMGILSNRNGIFDRLKERDRDNFQYLVVSLCYALLGIFAFSISKAFGILIMVFAMGLFAFRPVLCMKKNNLRKELLPNDEISKRK